MIKEKNHPVCDAWQGKPLFSALPIICVIGLVLPTLAWANMTPFDWAFKDLDYVRGEKVSQLESFCNRLKTMAGQVPSDPVVMACFDINLKAMQAQALGQVPLALSSRVAEFRRDFNQYYIENYLAFYDILFVDTEGQVFYSIRKESDLNGNILSGDSADTLLRACLVERPQERAFVDFHYYEPSSEAAAFFVVPVEREGAQAGWIILQCAINKVNSVFAWEDGLGKTGETFLVNQAGYMLTESNFDGASTILTKHLDDRNIQAKFREKQGHRVVTDYRGQTALTSFQVVSFLGTPWLVVAKVDRDEVITRHYVQHRRYCAEYLRAALDESPSTPLGETPGGLPSVTHRIDMDEFVRADNGECLLTFGISTCTGLVACYPGKFAYMAHISPKDRIYGADETNLLGQMMMKIRSFDIYPSEKRRMRFVIVAPHLNSQFNIIDKLVAEGFLLSQIRLLYRPTARSAAMSFDGRKDVLTVTWNYDNHQKELYRQPVQDLRDVGTIVQQAIQSDYHIQQELAE